MASACLMGIWSEPLVHSWYGPCIVAGTPVVDSSGTQIVAKKSA